MLKPVGNKTLDLLLPDVQKLYVKMLHKNLLICFQILVIRGPRKPHTAR